MLKGRTAVVTGSTSGIGLGIAGALAAEGCGIVLNGFGEPATIERLRAGLAERHNVDVVYVAADMAKPAEIRGLVEAAARRFGAVDILVNNAGMGSLASPSADKAFLAMTEADWDQGIDVSLKTAFLVTRAFLPAMVEAGYGRIVNVASVTGPLVSFEGTSAYSAAKAGMVGLTRTLALEVARSGITANAVAPGWIETGSSSAMERQAALHTPPARAGRPDEVAAAVVFLASEGASYVNGALLVVDGGNSLQERKG